MPNEVLEKYRQKYPKYADVPDADLAKAIVAKHPVYADRLKDVLVQHTFGSEQIKERPTNDPEQVLLDAKVAGVEAYQDARRTWDESMQAFGNGNPVAGILGLGSFVTKIPNPLLAATTELIRPGILGEGGPVNLVGGAESALGTVGEFTGGHFREGSRHLATTLGASPETAEAIAKPAGEIGSVAGQSVVAGVAGKTIGGLRPSKFGSTMSNVGETMAMRALKAGDDLATRQRLTRKAISYPEIQITPEGAGIAKSNKQMLQGEKMQNVIDPATKRGDLISVSPIRQQLKALQDKFDRSGGRFDTDKRALRRVADKFETIVQKEGFEGEYLTPSRLELFKEDLNAILTNEFKAERRGKQPELSTSAKQAMKVEVRGARKELEGRYSGLKELNREQGDWIAIESAIDDVLFESSGGSLTRPIGMTAMLSGSPAGTAAVAFSEIFTKPKTRFNLGGKMFRAGQSMQGRPVSGGGIIPPYSTVPAHSQVPTQKQLPAPARQMPAGEPEPPLSTGYVQGKGFQPLPQSPRGPYVHYGTVGLADIQRQIGGMGKTAGGATVPPLPLEGTPIPQTHYVGEQGFVPKPKMGYGAVDVVWNPKKKAYEAKK